MLVLDLVGVFAFAVSGALVAIRRDLDVVGIALLAVVTALGGGLVRDVVLGDTPPAAFTQWPHLVVPLVAAALTALVHPVLERLGPALLLSDAAGLGLYSVAGTVKALEHGLGPVAAALLGVTSAVGGGVLRDVLARETPALVRPGSELYALPAAAGALVVAVAWSAGLFTPALGLVVAGLVLVVRVLAMRRHWHGPRARRRRVRDDRLRAPVTGRAGRRRAPGAVRPGPAEHPDDRPADP